MTFSVPPKELENIIHDIRILLEEGTATAKRLARIAGMLSSMHLAIGSLVRLFTRSLYHQIASSPSWYKVNNLSPGTTHDLNFWLTNLPAVNGFTF